MTLYWLYRWHCKEKTEKNKLESSSVMCDLSRKLNANSSMPSWANPAAGKCPHFNLCKDAGLHVLGLTFRATAIPPETNWGFTGWSLCMF